MIVDSETNARFAGSAGYITDEDAGSESESGAWERAKEVFGFESEPQDMRVSTVETRNIFHTEDPMEAAREMQITANARKKVKKPVYSISLSYHPDDDPTDQEMVEDMDTFLQRRGLGEHQAVLAVHRDKAHSHIHATVNLVHPSAEKTWRASFDYYENMRVCRELERERGWTQVERDQDAGRIADWKYRRFDRTGKVPFGQVVRSQAEEVFAESESWEELSSRLAGQGLRVVRAGSGGRITDGEESAPLSEVARKWSFNKLDAKYPDQFEPYEQAEVARESRSGGNNHASREGGRDRQENAHEGLSDEKFSDEKPSDERFSDEELFDEELSDEELSDEELSDEELSGDYYLSSIDKKLAEVGREAAESIAQNTAERAEKIVSDGGEIPPRVEEDFTALVAFYDLDAELPEDGLEAGEVKELSELEESSETDGPGDMEEAGESADEWETLTLVGVGMGEADEHFEQAEAWRELDRALRRRGLRLEEDGSLRHEPTGETVSISAVGEGHKLAKLEEKFGERYADYLERREKMDQRPHGLFREEGSRKNRDERREGPAQPDGEPDRDGEAEGQSAGSDRKANHSSAQRHRDTSRRDRSDPQKAQRDDRKTETNSEESEEDRRRSGGYAEGGEASLEDDYRARGRPGGDRGPERAASGGGQDEEEIPDDGSSDRRGDRRSDQRDSDPFDTEQSDDESPEPFELPGVDLEEAEEEVEPLDVSGAEPFDSREVGAVSEEDLPGEPIDPSLPEDEMRQEARRWVGRDLGRTSLSAEMTEGGEYLSKRRSEPIDEEELRRAETEELQEKKREISDHKREANRRWSDLPMPRKDVPETVKQKRFALRDEQKAAEAHIEQIEAEIERRPTGVESRIRSDLEEVKEIERVLERGTVKGWIEEKTLTEMDVQEKRVRRARLLDRAKERLGGLDPEKRRGVRHRIEENRSRLAEVLDEAEDPSRPGADQVKTRVVRDRIQSDLDSVQRAEERGQETRKHDILDRVEREIGRLSDSTTMTEREAEKAVAEGLSTEERSLLREATDPGRPSADEIRSGGQSETSGSGESSGPGETSSRSKESNEEKGRGGSEDQSPGRTHDRGPGL